MDTQLPLDEWLMLPGEIWLAIVFWLCMKDVVSCASVCSKLRNMLLCTTSALHPLAQHPAFYSVLRQFNSRDGANFEHVGFGEAYAYMHVRRPPAEWDFFSLRNLRVSAAWHCSTVDDVKLANEAALCEKILGIRAALPKSAKKSFAITFLNRERKCVPELLTDLPNVGVDTLVVYDDADVEFAQKLSFVRCIVLEYELAQTIHDTSFLCNLDGLNALELRRGVCTLPSLPGLTSLIVHDQDGVGAFNLNDLPRFPALRSLTLIGYCGAVPATPLTEAGCPLATITFKDTWLAHDLLAWLLGTNVAVWVKACSITKGPRSFITLGKEHAARMRVESFEGGVYKVTETCPRNVAYKDAVGRPFQVQMERRMVVRVKTRNPV